MEKIIDYWQQFSGEGCRICVEHWVLDKLVANVKGPTQFFILNKI